MPRSSWRRAGVRVDELEIGEIYRVIDDERDHLAVVEVQYDSDKFLKFGHTVPSPPSSTSEPMVLDTPIQEPLVYIGTKRSRMYTYESVEHTHVFASTTGEHFCVLGRHIKYILPFTL